MKKQELGNRLHAAIKEEDYNKVKDLLKSDYNVKEQSSEENIQTIFYAVQFKRLDIVKLLVDNGAKFNCEDLKQRDQEFIIDLIKKDRVEMIENLVKAGLDVNFPLTRNYYGYRLLNVAAEEGYKAMILKLIELGAEVDGVEGDKTTPLIVAAFHGQLENVKVLLEKGANPNANGEMYPYQCNCCPEEYTPLTAAFNSENPQVFLKILEAGADLFNDALHKANSKELILSLIEHGADVNSVDYRGYTPLMCAAYSDHLEIVKVLLEKGADPKAGSGYDLALMKNEEIRRLLLEKY